MSSLNKCYGSLPPDGSRPNNLLEEIGQVSDAQTCQSFCKDLYRGSRAWFIFDRTTNDCKLFSGSLDDLRADCKEVGYAKEPNHSSCDTVFASNSSNGCYNFREDYCRFEFSLLENLEDIETLSECQLACQYINNCSYFVYDAPTKICKLNTIASSRPICDIIHGTPEPDFNSCVNAGHLNWASNETKPQIGQSTSNEASPVDCVWDELGEWSECTEECGGGQKSRSRDVLTPASNGGNDCDGGATETNTCNTEPCPVDCQWGPYGEWSNCTKDCGGGEKTRTRNEATPASNGGQECDGNSTEKETCNQEECPSDEEFYTLLNENVRCSGTNPLQKGFNDEFNAQSCREVCDRNDACKFYATWKETSWCETYSECPSETPDGSYTIRLWKRNDKLVESTETTAAPSVNS